ncbi:hypothetical protein MED222_05545 [Vibrio sp. MED222]|nr:hypothetical protein MED222_05545 [Vibrio sp. MED222]
MACSFSIATHWVNSGSGSISSSRHR